MLLIECQWPLTFFKVTWTKLSFFFPFCLSTSFSGNCPAYISVILQVDWVYGNLSHSQFLVWCTHKLLTFGHSHWCQDYISLKSLVSLLMWLLKVFDVKTTYRKFWTVILSVGFDLIFDSSLTGKIVLVYLKSFIITLQEVLVVQTSCRKPMSCKDFSAVWFDL